MTILQRHDAEVRARRHHDRDRPQRRRQVDRVQDRCSACCRCAPGGSGSTAQDIDEFHAAPACWTPASATCRKGATSSPSSRCGTISSSAAWRCADQSRPAASASSAMMARFPMLREKANAAGVDAVGRPAEAARSRARPAARPQADADRRALDRPVAADGAGGVRHPARPAASKGVTILMIEQNAKQALECRTTAWCSSWARPASKTPPRDILADPRIAQLFLGGGLAPAEEAAS